MSNEKEVKLKKACSEWSDKPESERRERVNKVASILEGVKYKTESDKAGAIISFSKSKLSTEEIEFIANTMKPEYRSNAARSVGVY